MSARGIIGGAIGAIIASICYFLPLLLIFAGVSVAAGLVVSQYRPFFLLLGVLFVVFYILLNIYSKTQNSSCSFVEVSKKERKFVITTIFAFFTLFALINFLIIPMLDSTRGDKKVLENPETYRTVELKITGMTCPGCADVLERLLIKKTGVVNADVDYESGYARVVFDPAQISVDEIVETLKPYEVEVISELEVNK